MQDSYSHLIIKELPPSAERLPLFIVGDVHGCRAELANLISLAKQHVKEFQLVLVGDLFTKGPDPVGVYELIQEHKALCIKGNHDWALAFILQQIQKKIFKQNSEHTKQTLRLLRYHKRSILDFLMQLPHAYTTTIEMASSVSSRGEKSFPMAIVHAGIDPTRGLKETSERMLLTARYVRWDQKESQKLVLAPSSGQSRLQEVPPVDADHTMRFRWHELHQGPELIVFGHDAKQGLFRKTLPSGRPICVGIDTGCTYGNHLTGYFPELDLAIQCPAQRKYFDAKRNLILLQSSFSSSGAL